MAIKAVNYSNPIDGYSRSIADNISRDRNINAAKKNNSINSHQQNSENTQDSKSVNNPEVYYSSSRIENNGSNSKSYYGINSSNTDEASFTIVQDNEENTAVDSVINLDSYYAVNDRQNDTLNYKTMIDYSNMWKDRILKAYHVGLCEQPGSLVNLVI